ISVSLTALMKIFRDMTQISVRCSSSGTPFRVVRLPQNVLMATRPSAVFFSHLMRWQRRWNFHQGDAVLHRLLHLLEGTPAYLAHALGRDAELVGELLERDRFFGEPARLEDAPLPVVEHGERRGEGLAAAAELLACGECRLLVEMLVDQPVLPLAGIAVLTDRSIERYIAPKAPVHVDHVLLGDAEASGDELDLVRA